MTHCPCGSGHPHDACCGPYLAGDGAPTAEALMRSRYAAFVLGNIDYLGETLAPDIRHEFDPIEAASTVENADWQGLEIRKLSQGGVEDTEGRVEFVARFRLGKEQRLHHEDCEFQKIDGRWYVSGGIVDPKQPTRQVSKVGRNEPCPCGSGKKYKKCCGA